MRQIPVNTPPLALAALAGMIQEPSPACENSPRPTIEGKRRGSNPMSSNQAQELIGCLNPSEPILILYVGFGFPARCGVTADLSRVAWKSCRRSST
jgi:hypothetical protein